VSVEARRDTGRSRLRSTPRSGCRGETVTDVEHHLALDEQVVIEGEGILREIHHPLDRVLDGHESCFHLARLYGVEDVRYSAVRHVCNSAEIRLADECLLGKGAGRTKESYTGKRKVWHGRQQRSAELVVLGAGAICWNWSWSWSWCTQRWGWQCSRNRRVGLHGRCVQSQGAQGD
jgi:hypothetical protein